MRRPTWTGTATPVSRPGTQARKIFVLDSDRGGGKSMAFYNVQHGDAPLLKKLADQYTISDYYHQPAMGGTGLQHVFLGTGDDVFWSDGNGNPTVPPAAHNRHSQ